MDNDPELEALGTITRVLEPLDEGARKRVLGFAVSRYGIDVQRPAMLAGLGAATSSILGDYADFPELFDAADPKTEEDKALVACYWFHVHKEIKDLDAQTINNALKDMGHGLSNITRALAGLQARKPALVRQIQKSGKTKQARKKYRLTTEGIKAVQEMLRGPAEDED